MEGVSDLRHLDSSIISAEQFAFHPFLRFIARSMATKLDKALKREIDVNGRPHMLTIDADGLKLTEKGRRKGVQLRWEDLVDGDAALATALNASLGGK